MRRSPDATLSMSSDEAPKGACLATTLTGSLLLLFAIWLFVSPTLARAQSSGSQPTQVTPPPAQSEIKENSAELATHDEPTTFKVNVRLVLVRAVVRDLQGHAVGNLHKEDFQVFDKGKPQVISQFEVEQPGTLIAKARQASDENSDGSVTDTSSKTGPMPEVPERFIAYLFDDVHLEFGDLAQVRKAAERHLSTLRPTDRAAIFTTSGRTMLDYTDDRAKLHETLFRLVPQPIVGQISNLCPKISYYEANEILNKNDTLALQVAVQEATACPPPLPPNLEQWVSTISQEILDAGDHETRISLGVLKDVVRNLSTKPGQRTMVLISPGFITPQMEYDYGDTIDRAVRSQVILNTLDARGLYVVAPGGDISNPNPGLPPPGKNLIEMAAASAQDDLLAVLADSTGGVFFHNNNDMDEGLRRVAETPEYSYVLAFVPQNLKPDGGYHSLKVTVKSTSKLSVQARHGYYAPKTVSDPAQQAKQDIEEAVFSQEEMHDLPVKMHTQFFKATDEDAKLTVLAHVDVRLLHFRKLEGRNSDVLTCVSALFNRNGNLIQGIEKTVTMHLKDDTLANKLGSGITLKTSFDVKPGSYMVRVVVRDAEGQLMSAENGTVEIR
jgi:VWFA-related protein